MACYREEVRWEKPPCAPPKRGLDLGKAKCRGGRGGCSCISPGDTSRGPCSSFPKLLCLCSWCVLCCAAGTPGTAVCTTKPIASFVEAFNDSGAGSSPGTVSTASTIPPSMAACSRSPRGAKLRLASLEMCCQDIWSLLYFHSNHFRPGGVELNGLAVGMGREGSSCLCREGPC